MRKSTVSKDLPQPEPEPGGLSALEQFFFLNPLREIYGKVRQGGWSGQSAPS